MKGVYRKYYNALRSIKRLKRRLLNAHTKSKYSSSDRDSRIIFYNVNVSIVDMISSEDLKFKFTVPLDTTQKNLVQGLGSTMTYMRLRRRHRSM